MSNSEMESSSSDSSEDILPPTPPNPKKIYTLSRKQPIPPVRISRKSRPQPMELHEKFPNNLEPKPSTSKKNILNGFDVLMTCDSELLDKGNSESSSDEENETVRSISKGKIRKQSFEKINTCESIKKRKLYKSPENKCDNDNQTNFFSMNEEMEIDDPVNMDLNIEDDISFSTILGFDKEVQENPSLNKSILKTLVSSTKRANFIRKSIIKSCIDVFHILETGVEGNAQVLTLLDHILFAANTFPHVFCKMRRKKSRKPKIFVIDECSPDEIQSLLEVIFTAVPVLLFRLSLEGVRTQTQRVLQKILNVLFYNSQPCFHWALENIEAVILKLINPKDNIFKVKLNFIPENITFDICIPIQDVKFENLTNILDILRKYWYHMLNRCIKMAEMFLQILGWIWQTLPIPEKFILIKYFPVPLSESSLKMDVHACHLFEMIVKDSLYIIDSVEFLSFCTVFEKFQFIHDSCESVGFILKVHLFLNKLVMTNDFIMSPLVLTKTALVRLLCRIKDYIKEKTMPSAREHDFGLDFLVMLPQNLPRTLTAMDGMVFRECITSFDLLGISQPELCRSPPESEDEFGVSVLQIRPALIPKCQYQRPEIIVPEISELWRTFFVQWQKYLFEYKDDDKTECNERLLILTNELIKLANLVNVKLKLPEGNSIQFKKKDDITRRIHEGKINVIFFPFGELKTWSQIIPKILQKAERTEGGMQKFLALIIDSFESMPPLVYNDNKDALQEVQKAWMFYASSLWWPTDPVILCPPWTIGGYKYWENKSIEKCDILLDKCVKVLTNDTISPVDKTTLTIFTKAMSCEFMGSTIGMLKLIGEFNKRIRKFKWQVVFRFIEKVVYQHMWKEHDELTIFLAKAIARLPCILSNKQEEIETGNVSLNKDGCDVCTNNGNNCFLDNMTDPLLDLGIENAINRLLQPVVLYCNHVQAKYEAVKILHHLRCHGREAKPFIATNFIYHLAEPAVGFVEHLLSHVKKYLDFNKRYNEYSINYLKTLDVVFLKIAMHIRSLPSRGGGKKEMLTLSVGLMELAKTKDIQLIIQVVRLVFNILLTFKNNTANAICKRLLDLLAQENQVSSEELLFSLRHDLAKDLVNYCLTAFFGKDPNASTISPHPLPKVKGKKNFPKSEPKPVLNILDVTNDEKNLQKQCIHLLERLVFIVQGSNENFVQYYGPVILAQLIPLIREDRRRLLMIHSLAIFSDVTVRGLLLEYFPVYFPILVVGQEIEVINEVMALINHLGVEMEFIGKCLFQSLTDEMAVHLSVNKNAILRHFSCLTLWAKGKVYRTPAVAIQTEIVMDFIGARLMGVYVFVNHKLHSPLETWETKRRILASFAQLIGVIGQNRLAPTMLKVFSTLKEFAHLGHEIHDVLCQAWSEFAKCLDDTCLGAMIRQILGAIISLAQTTSEYDILDELVLHIIDRRQNVFRNMRKKLYFLVDHVKNIKTLELLRKHTPTGNALFGVLLEELTHNNTHIHHFAMTRLLDFLSGREGNFDKHALFLSRDDSQQQVCKLILALMEITRSKFLETRLLAGKCLGLLGAIDNYRSMFKTLSEGQSWIGTDFKVTLPAFAGQYLEQLRVQLQIVNQAEDFDHCAFCIQEVLKLYGVEATRSNVIWNSLSTETRVLMAPLLQSKYTLTSEICGTEYPTPIYASEHGNNFHSWSSSWMLQMISYMKEDSFNSKLFNLSKTMIVRNVKLASFLLPNVALHAVIDCPEEKLDTIRQEMHNLLLIWSSSTVRGYEQNSEAIDVESQLPYEVLAKTSHSDVEIIDRILCTNAILSIMDILNLCIRVSTHVVALPSIPGQPIKYCTKIGGGKFELKEEDIKRMQTLLLDYESLSHAAFRTESYQRALIYIEEFLTANPHRLQDTLPYLQRIYVALRDVDGISGLAALRENVPATIELVLDNLSCGKTVEASYLLERLSKEYPDDFIVRQSCIQSYLSLDQPEMAYNLIDAYEKQRPQSRSFLQYCRVEACWKLEKWEELEEMVKAAKKTRNGKRWAYTVAHILVCIQNNELTKALTSIVKARKRVLSPLALASLDVDAYYKRYGEVTRLHTLAEMEQVVELLQVQALNVSDCGLSNSQNRNFRSDTTILLNNWDHRRGGCQTLKVLDPVLHIRKALLTIMKKHMKSEQWALPLLDGSIRDTWLSLAKAERKTKNFIRVRNCIEEARAYACATVTYQEAKYLTSSGDTEKAISLLQRGIALRSGNLEEWKRIVMEGELLCDEQKLCSKLMLLFAILNDIKANVGMQENICNYTDALNLNKESERNNFHLAYAYNRIWDSVESGEQTPDLETLTTGILALVRHYCLSLQYGCKNIYHSVPRLLSVWLDCRWSQFLLHIVENGKMNKKILTDTQNEMTGYIKTLREKVPCYVFLTAFSQLISRLCHNDKGIWKELKEIIGHILCEYPHQALWMTVAVSKSSYAIRKQRCTEIFRLAENRKQDLKPLLRDYNTLAEKLIEVSNNPGDGSKTARISALCGTLPKLLSNPNFSKVMVPFQQFLSCCLPRKIGLFDHRNINPFPHSVYIAGIEDKVQIMPSLQKPKKITFRGSDGKQYGVMCKPKDDLRKDSKVMEMNHILNWYLGREAEARQRQLHIRTYAVVPLNEQCGLIEWLPNLVGLRPIAFSIFKKKAIDMSYVQSTACNNQPTDPLEKKMDILNECLQRYKPVMAEYLLLIFPDPRVWYLARENYTRTAAVMSIFGYLLGLGDRHGENILIDTMSGEVVHVDFNCLFNMGETFRWPERVPFRLTQNMTTAMGILGFEGTFRRSCEVTLRVLRSNASIFISVLRPFVFDPLVEWSKKQSEPVSGTGEISNDKAREHMKNFTLRLEGKRRNMTKKLDLALSVEAQVNYLIQEARDPQNLCQMYHGWAPYI